MKLHSAAETAAAKDAHTELLMCMLQCHQGVRKRFICTDNLLIQNVDKARSLMPMKNGMHLQNPVRGLS